MQVAFTSACNQIILKLKKGGQQLSKDVIMSVNAGCCSMAGNRRFLNTELTGAATRPEASALMAQQ